MGCDGPDVVELFGGLGTKLRNHNFMAGKSMTPSYSWITFLWARYHRMPHLLRAQALSITMHMSRDLCAKVDVWVNKVGQGVLIVVCDAVRAAAVSASAAAPVGTFLLPND